MSNRRKVSVKNIVQGLALLLFVFMTAEIKAKYNGNGHFFNSLTAFDTIIKPKIVAPKKAVTPPKKDTTSTTKRTPVISKVADSTRRNDTLPVKKDTTIIQSISLDSIRLSKDSLDAPIEYSATDSIVFIVPTKEVILYNKATTNYHDLNLEASTILFDQQKNLITAYGSIDTATGLLNKTKFTQNGSTSLSDTIYYNIKTQKGITKNTYYQEGEIFVNAVRVKKVEADVAFAYQGRFTTCNLDTPHFAFRTRKMKLINNKLAVSGPAYPEFEGVPVPVGIPFGIFPLNRNRHSGFLPPQFAATEDFGLGLEGIGFYKVLNDNFDVTVRGNIYSYGGWSMNINPRYLVRYKYNGNLTFSLQNTKILNRGVLIKDEFIENKGFNISWSHTRDSRAKPGTSFNANVNAGSTKFNQYVTNNAYRNFQNQLSSSIAWTKTWNGKYNLSVNLNHDQNNNTRLVNLNLPTVAFSANTFYPFQQKQQIGEERWYEKIGISYTGNVLNRISFYDSAFKISKLLDTMQWGARHSIPISLSLPALGPIILSPSLSYSENWFAQSVYKRWNESTNKLDTTTTKGFFAAREVQFGIAASTRIFGTFNFGQNSHVQAIRHEIKPFISANYKPDLVKKYYYNMKVDSAGKNVQRFNRFEGNIVQGFSEGRFGGMNFGIDNLLEMKVKNKDTSIKKANVVRLIDALSISSGYNFLEDSFQLQVFNIGFRSTLFDKVSITGNALIDPYGVDTFGTRRNKLVWEDNRFSVGRFSQGSLAISTSFQSKKAENKKDVQTTYDPTLTPDEQQRQLDYVRQNPAEFVDFSTPWSVQLSFSLNFQRVPKPDYKGYRTDVNSNLNLNGDFSLSPKWKMGGGTYIDMRTRKIETLTMFITREMHCWQMAINLTPVGLFRSFSISLSPKSGILRDLKINRSRFFYNQ
jgi:LPS-assembly protein